MLDFHALTPVLRELHNISGFRISVHDTEFREVAAYPTEQTPFCRLIKGNKGACEACHRSDRIAFERVRETREVYLYQCSFGLYDAVAPLYSLGQLSGYLMMGQTLDNTPNGREYAYRSAAPYFSEQNKVQVSKAVSQIYIRAKENILSCISIMGICAEYITLTNRLNSTGRDLAHETRRYIRASFAEKLSIDELCSRFFCSRATLMNTFKRKYKQSINEYITQVRIEQARELLDKTDLSVSRIAEQCGFSDQNYFSKVFAKLQGKSPTVYRKESRDAVQ